MPQINANHGLSGGESYQNPKEAIIWGPMVESNYGTYINDDLIDNCGIICHYKNVTNPIYCPISQAVLIGNFD